MKISIRYGSHLPVLMAIVGMTDGPILELGIGLYSTPFLHFACLPTNRKLVSYDSDPGWIRYFKDCRSNFHQVNLIDDWNKLDISDLWDVVLVDHSPDARRHVEVARLANQAKYLILHDSDLENDALYKYSEVYPLFKYRFDYTLCKPHTTILSNLCAINGAIVA